MNEQTDSYTNATIATQLAAQRRHNHPLWAIFTDIDDTLIDRSGDTEALAAAWKLRDIATKNNWPIIVATGNPIGPVADRIDRKEMPNVEAMICDVGTTIWLAQNDGSLMQDKTYEERLKSTGFIRHSIVQQASNLIAELAQTQPAMEVQFQNPEREAAYLQTPDATYLPYKVSLYFFGNEENAAALGESFAEYFPALRIVTCKEIHYNATLPPHATVQKYCLDIVPATKADAMAYLIETLGIQAGIKAGDSGNDTDMLLHDDPLVGVLVGGHKTEAEAAVTAHINTTHKNGMSTLKNGRQFYVEVGPHKAAQSILQAISLIAPDAV